jgi:hypothetical protein
MIKNCFELFRFLSKNLFRLHVVARSPQDLPIEKVWAWGAIVLISKSLFLTTFLALRFSESGISLEQQMLGAFIAGTIASGLGLIVVGIVIGIFVRESQPDVSKQAWTEFYFISVLPFLISGFFTAIPGLDILLVCGFFYSGYILFIGLKERFRCFDGLLIEKETTVAPAFQREKSEEKEVNPRSTPE